MSYIVYKHIDYLSYTNKLRIQEIGIRPEFHYQVSDSGLYGYTHSAKCNETGELMLWSDKRPDMGTHVIMSGETLQWYRYNGHTDKMLVEDAMRKGKIRRIDLAITSHPNTVTRLHELRPIDLLALDNNGKCKTNLKDRSEISESGRIQTIYLGSRKRRKRLFRAYDKGIESGYVSDWLQRYELQSSGDGSLTVAHAIATDTDIGSIMNRYVSYKNSIWDQIVGTDSAVMDHTPNIKKPDTVAWLRDVAAASLARIACENESPEAVLQWFMLNVREKMKNIRCENLTKV